VDSGLHDLRSCVGRTVLLAAATANAQSPARAKRNRNRPSVSGPKAVEKKTVPDKDVRIPVLVAIEDHNPFSGIPYYLAGTIRDTCADRLRKSPDLKVGLAERGMNRSEAVKLAKTEKETYVVCCKSKVTRSIAADLEMELPTVYTCATRSTLQ